MIGKNKAETILMSLYREIVIDGNYENSYPMRFGMDICVNEKGVEIRNQLAVLLLQDKFVYDKWSGKSILEEINNIISELGIKKRTKIIQTLKQRQLN